MIKIGVLGKSWELFVLNDDTFAHMYGEDLAAITRPDVRQLVFASSELNLGNVTHELCHAYYASLCTAAASLTLNQQEEVFCEMFAEHGSAILKTSKLLLKALQDEDEA